MYERQISAVVILLVAPANAGTLITGIPLSVWKCL
jgi:hypothetical protein